MRVRLLDIPEVIELINRESIPVEVNLTDRGFPEDVPALKVWERTFKRSPWSRFSFGSFVVLDGEGAHSFGNSGCQIGGRPSGDGNYPESRKTLERALERFREANRLRRLAKEDATAKFRLEALYAELEDEKALVLPCGSDDRLLTARYLLSKKCDAMLDAMSCDEQGRPRLTKPEVHRLGVAALGRFVSDDRPFAQEARGHLEFIDLTLRRLGFESSAEPSRIVDLSKALPETLLRRGAVALAKLTGQSWDLKSPDLLNRVRRWWADHKVEYD